MGFGAGGVEEGAYQHQNRHQHHKGTAAAEDVHIHHAAAAVEDGHPHQLMAVGHHGSTGVVLAVKVVIRQDTVSVPIPHQPTVDLDALELIRIKGIAMSVLFVWQSANIYAIILTVHSSAVAILGIKHRHKIGKDARESPVTQVTGHLQATDRCRLLVVVNLRFPMGLRAWSRAIMVLK